MSTPKIPAGQQVDTGNYIPPEKQHAVKKAGKIDVTASREKLKNAVADFTRINSIPKTTSVQHKYSHIPDGSFVDNTGTERNGYKESMQNALKGSGAGTTENIKLLQQSLKEWMPSLKGDLPVDGKYKESTRKTVDYLSKIYTTADGRKIQSEEDLSRLLVDLRNKHQGYLSEEKFKKKYSKTKDGEKIYAIMYKHGRPPFTKSKTPLTDDEYKTLKRNDREIEGKFVSELSNLKEGEKTNNKAQVKLLQDSLVKWMPSWKGKLKCDGNYGTSTKEALQYFKNIYGLGKDGTSVDEKTAKALLEIKDGSFWDENNTKYKKSKFGNTLYNLAERSGYPASDDSNVMKEIGSNGKPLHESPNHPVCLNNDEVRAVHSFDSERIVSYRSGNIFQMKASAAKKFVDFKQAFSKQFPGYSVDVTSTMEPSTKHSDTNHYNGTAVDFVFIDSSGNTVSQYIKNKNGKTVDLTNEGENYNSLLKKLMNNCGLREFNEYSNSSTYKTGSHMHVDIGGS